VVKQDISIPQFGVAKTAEEALGAQTKPWISHYLVNKREENHHMLLGDKK